MPASGHCSGASPSLFCREVCQVVEPRKDGKFRELRDPRHHQEADGAGVDLELLVEVIPHNS